MTSSHDYDILVESILFVKTSSETIPNWSGRIDNAFYEGIYVRDEHHSSCLGGIIQNGQISYLCLIQVKHDFIPLAGRHSVMKIRGKQQQKKSDFSTSVNPSQTRLAGRNRRWKSFNQ